MNGITCILAIYDIPMTYISHMYLKLIILVWYVRVPSQVAFSNSLCFPCPSATFPCTNLHDLWLLHTQNWLGRLFQLQSQISKYLLPLESGDLQLEQTKFPVFWHNFKIPCVFPDRDFWGPFSLFSLCTGYPDMYNLIFRWGCVTDGCVMCMRCDNDVTVWRVAAQYLRSCFLNFS